MSPQIHAGAMIDTDRIRVAFERDAKALTKRLSPGLKTAVSKVRITDRLSCQTEESPWYFTADMPEQGGRFSLWPGSRRVRVGRLRKLYRHRIRHIPGARGDSVLRD